MVGMCYAHDANGLAAYVVVIWQGLSAAARDGHTRKQLMAVVDQALNAWPRPHAR